MTHDRSRIVALYTEDGWTATAIAAEVGCHRTTVYRHLTEAGVKRDDRANSIAARGEFCKAGLHPMAVSARITRTGARCCRECEAIAAVWRSLTTLPLGSEPDNQDGDR